MTNTPIRRTAASGRPNESPQRTMFSLAAALRILKLFGDDEIVLPLELIMFRAHLNEAKVRRVITQLEQLGYVKRHHSDSISLTTTALTLGFAARPTTLAGLAQRRLETLAHSTNATVSLAKLVGDQVLYLSRISNGDVMSANVGVGSTTPAWTDLIGHVLLASLRHDQLLDPANPHALALQPELESIRANGYASSSAAESSGAIWCICVPVGASGSRPSAAISISIAPGSARQFSQSDLLAQLHDAADDLTRQIAWAELE